MKILKGLFALVSTFILIQSYNAHALGGFSRFLGKPVTICGPGKKHCLHAPGGVSEGVLISLHGDNNYNQRHHNGRFVIRRDRRGGYTICTDNRKFCIGDGASGLDHLGPLRLRKYSPRGANARFKITQTGQGRNDFTICAIRGRFCLHGWGGYSDKKPIRYHGNHAYNRTKVNGRFNFTVAKFSEHHKPKKTARPRRFIQQRKRTPQPVQREEEVDYDY